LGQQRWIKTLGIGHGEVLGDTAAGLAPTVAREVAGAIEPPGVRGVSGAPEWR